MQTGSTRGFLILGTSLIIAAAVFGLFFLFSRTVPGTVRAVGAATMRTDSDIAKLRMFVNVRVGVGEMERGYREVSADVAALLSRLARAGFEEKETSVKPASAMPNYTQQGGISGYTIQQPVSVISGQIDVVEEIAMHPEDLISAGINVESMRIEYYNSRLDDMKKELLARAAGDARERAEEIIRTSGMNINGIQSARAGVFQIKEPYSTEVTDYGIYDTSTREKEITVTVAVTFVVE